MSKLTHAPGPWRMDKDNLNVYANGMVAQTYGHIHNGEREANARLIAAAPDMLEALKGLMISLVSQSAVTPKLFDAANAAIAKAEDRGP